MTTDPAYREYGLLSWLLHRGPEMLKQRRWLTAWADDSTNPPTVRAFVLRPLYALSARYRAYVERVWAHEYGHTLGIQHVDDERDIMGRTFGDNLHDLDAMTDRHDVMRKSTTWRDTIRNRSTYPGTPEATP